MTVKIHGKSFKDLSGRKFGRLTVIKYSHTENRQIKWECLCSCGKVKNVCACNLLNGSSKSCGCLNRELTKERSTIHGKSRSRIYRIWRNMQTRCENKKHLQFKNYGGRGISVCLAWHNSMAFIQWAMSHGYKDDLTIDRINNDGNYEPANCHWIPLKDQAKNKGRGIK